LLCVLSQDKTAYKTEAEKLRREVEALTAQLRTAVPAPASQDSGTVVAKYEAEIAQLRAKMQDVNSALAARSSELTRAQDDGVRARQELDACVARAHELTAERDDFATKLRETAEALSRVNADNTALRAQVSGLKAERDRLVTEADSRPASATMGSPAAAGSPLPSRVLSERDAGRIRRLNEQIAQLQDWYGESVLRAYFGTNGLNSMCVLSVALCLHAPLLIPMHCQCGRCNRPVFRTDQNGV
jgi:uncharacterized protein YukE